MRVHRYDPDGLPPQHLTEEEIIHVLPAPDPLGIQSASGLPAIAKDPLEEDHLDDLLNADPLQGDLHQDTTGDLGLLLVLRIAAMPGMTAMLTVHLHGASAKLLSLAD